MKPGAFTFVTLDGAGNVIGQGYDLCSDIKFGDYNDEQYQHEKMVIGMGIIIRRKRGMECFFTFFQSTNKIKKEDKGS